MASLDLSAAFDKVNIDLLERKITNRDYCLISKLIFLAGLHALLYVAGLARLSWACGQVFHQVLEL